MEECCKRAIAIKPTKNSRPKASFLWPPKDQFYGVECILKDNSLNWSSMTEPKGPDSQPESLAVKPEGSEY
jgi:hypothetical protein